MVICPGETMPSRQKRQWSRPKSDRRRRVRRCVVCGEVLPEPSPLGGRRRVYCSNACRQRAKRERDKQALISPG